MFFKNELMRTLRKIGPLIFSAINSFISLITTFYIAGALGTEIYGTLQYYLSIITVFSTIISFGLNYHLVKNANKTNNTKELFTNSFLLFDIVTLISFAPFLFFCFFFLEKLNHSIAIIIILFVASALFGLVHIVEAFLLGMKKINTSIFFMSLLPKIMVLIISLLLIFLLNNYNNFPVYYLYFFTCIYFLIVLPFLFIYLKKVRLHFEKKDFVSILFFFLISVTAILNNNVSKILQGEISDSMSNVGVLALCMQIVVLSQIFSGVITSISRPFFSAYSTDKEKLIAYFQKVLRINSYFVIPFLIAFSIEAKQLLSFFWIEYSAYPLILTILAISALVSNLTGPNGTMLSMAGHEKLEVLNSIIHIVVYFVFGLFLTKITIYGLPLAILFSTVIINVMKVIEIRIVYKINPYNFKIILHLCSMCLIASISFYLISLVNNPVLWILLNCVVGLLLIICYIFFSPYKDDKYFFIVKRKGTYEKTKY